MRGRRLSRRMLSFWWPHQFKCALTISNNSITDSNIYKTTQFFRHHDFPLQRPSTTIASPIWKIRHDLWIKSKRIKAEETFAMSAEGRSQRILLWTWLEWWFLHLPKGHALYGFESGMCLHEGCKKIKEN